MQKADQVSSYFLSDLEDFKVFVKLSERHWSEELVKYSEYDIDTNEAVCWERYQYRNDLSAHFKEVFPQYQKRSFLLILLSLFEDYLNQICYSLYAEKQLCCSLKDYSGSGIERAKKYLSKVAHVDVPAGTKPWDTIIKARDIRNIIAHNAGYLDKEKHSKHIKIADESCNLKIHKFARDEIEVTQSYLFEVILAMINIADKLYHNIRDGRV